MAAASILVGQHQLTCPVCLDLLKNPATIPCGHSYCMSCITRCWNQDDQKGIYSCPQCRQTFTPRPALCKNVVFAEMVENLKKTKLQTAVPASTSCQTHLDRREELRSSKPQKVINATGRPQQMICPQHHKQLEIYCRTDQHYICYMCAVDKHKHHITVTAIEERTEKQKHLEQTQRDSQQRIQQREKDLQELREVVEAHKHSALKAVEDSERNFTELIRSIERSCSEVTQLIRDQEKAAVNRAEELMKLIEQEIDDLRRRDSELEQLLRTDNHIHFLLNVESCSFPPPTTVVPRIKANSHLLYDDVGKSIFLLKKNLEVFCKERKGQMSSIVRDIEIISTFEKSVQSKERHEHLGSHGAPQPQSWAAMPGPPPSFHPVSESTRSRPQKEWSRSRSLSESKYWHFTE